MKSRRTSTAAILVVAAIASAACVRTTAGTPVAESGASSLTPRSTMAAPTSGNGRPEIGVVPTTRAAVPASGVTCSPATKPAVGVLAQTTDPRAPKVTVAVPEKWGMSAGSGDVGARITGPDGTFATVSIAATRLDPEAAFREYTDKLVGHASVSTVSIQPAELCDYSGQKLMGSWSDGPEAGVTFTDRIVHVGTNTGNYLIAVHVEAPRGGKQDEAAVALLTGDFEIRIP